MEREGSDFLGINGGGYGRSYGPAQLLFLAANRFHGKAGCRRIRGASVDIGVSQWPKS
jgi:hypothetical protein